MRLIARTLGCLALSATALLVVAAACAAAADASAPPLPVQRLIVKLRGTSAASAMQGAPQAVSALAAHAGFEVSATRHIVAGLHLLEVRGGGALASTLARLRADPRVEYAEPDERRHVLATPNDTLFSGQWYLQNTQLAAVDAVDAWDLTTGSAGVVVADLDTGVRFEHPDLRNATANRLLAGYDMIGGDSQGNFLTANDGDGRDPDASDPGDWVSAADQKNALFANCTLTNSTWHGTRVAGILAALSDNGEGIAGLSWSGWLLPVRVLGKCGGYDSDILAAMAWAAGLHVDGVPDNPYPARIINMSLGSVGSCPASYQQIIDQLLQLGVLVVVSAGNEGGPVDAPANCAGVAGVAAVRQVGTKVGFSSLGPEIALSAPGGNCVNTGAGEPCLFSIQTTTNTGKTAPVASTYTDQFNFNVGTSFSAPIVSGIAALMLSVNGNLTSEQLIARLQSGATTPFPAPQGVPVCHGPAEAGDLQTAECACTTQVCGAGMVNAHGAVLEALRPIAAVTLSGAVAPGTPVTLDGSGSAAACNANLASYQWTVVAPATNPPPIGNPTGAVATVIAPAAPASYTLMLTVTDDSGRSDSAQVIVTSSLASSGAPPRAGDTACLTPVSFTVAALPAGGAGGAPSGGGGGGGAADPVTLVTLLAALGALARRRRSQ
jgi:serine protease